MAPRAKRSTAPARWLTADEHSAWIALIHVMVELPYHLDVQLQRDAKVTHFEYGVMARLSEEPGAAMQLSALAAEMNASLSRLSHVLRRLEQRAFLHRYPLATNGRITIAELTEAGRAVLVAAAPLHVDEVRRRVFDRLSPEQTEQLRDICEAIAARP